MLNGFFQRAGKRVRSRADSSSTGILGGLEGLGKGNKRGGVTRLSFGSMSEAVEPLALGQREGLAHPGFLDRSPGNEVFTLLDGEVQDHCAGFGVDTQENRTGTTVTNLLGWASENWHNNVSILGNSL